MNRRTRRGLAYWGVRSSLMEQASVHDNRELQRYELLVDGQVVFANYRRQPGRLVRQQVEISSYLRRVSWVASSMAMTSYSRPR